MSSGRKFLKAWNTLGNAIKPSLERLTETVIELWEVEGSAGLSARRIGLCAGAPVSSIYHHFGSLEQLFVSAQDVALTSARSWCDEQLRQLARLPADISALPAFFAALVDEWVQAQRRLAFAWREGKLLAARHEVHQLIGERWAQLWSDFWREVGDKFGLGRNVVVVERVFETESLLHMLRWERMFDRAGLDELARGLSAWLTGGAMPPAPWRETARLEALRCMPALPERDTTTSAVMEAATDVLERHGVAGLTHRAVAAKAGLTLGVVLHKFRTKSELLTAAYEGVYLANVREWSQEARTGAEPRPGGHSLDTIAAGISRSAGAQGRDDLILAVARDPSLHQFAAQLRYLRGRSAIGALALIGGSDRQNTYLEAALFSSFASAQARPYGTCDEALLRERVRAELEIVAGLVRSSPASA